MRKTAKLQLTKTTIRNLSTAVLARASGGEPAESDAGHVCESVNACHGSVAPYACATDVRCSQTAGPCDQSAFGPCG